ncbi:NADPH:quinone reductase-like Zn-dependent oxidoreductase [Saccharopolyspora erythraea NRRL 2338]|uniref:quinone oxidoreductase family protein n=1 Tax=Saccharopolyspora erythraea TaxID=1836 RepID=UPI000313800F|nr:zinc-binding alcohol dehydrogenase family protein [Saccharopolyspora erythraea]EQD86561.1 alcohol dehydrogenase [Saccharopolyspora erythraea D]PFG94405.1 NADPH:quinone reductase-like Zn-dependent oxidoreductase [Saccharopolyspora erythraea NRRL 2338]QRK91167.1 zinc-binding alcohol dehydrogenase family protein [Saccharopolyspora erythraea]
MHAAVVRSFDHSPSYEELADPVAAEGQVVLKVVAAGLHPAVRAGAGAPATGRPRPPFIPGFDGVGRLPCGSRVFFAGLRHPYGSMAERAVVAERDCIPIPDDVDDVTVAATVNPSMSAWVAMRGKAGLEAGESVLVLGATGNAGRMAVQIARMLGAGRVVAAGRNRAMLDRLLEVGADDVVPLDGDDETVGKEMAANAAGVDVVLDYLSGRPAEIALHALAGGRRLRWVHVGSGGPVAADAGARKSRVEISQVDPESLPEAERTAELTSLINRMPSADLDVHAVSIPLHAVGSAWKADATTGVRIVLVP